MNHFTTLVASAQPPVGTTYPTLCPIRRGVTFTLPHGLLQLLYHTPDDDQLLHHSRLFEMVLSTGRHFPHCADWSVLLPLLVVQLAVDSLLHSLWLTIKGIKASV